MANVRRMTMPTPLCDNLRLPVIGSPLFIISGPELVIAQCKAGVIGSFPALNARPQGLLDEWLHQITEELAQHNRDNPDTPAAPYAVNQIVHKSNDRLEADLATCAKWQVPMVITSLGAREDLNKAVHGWGGIVMHDIISDRFARKAIEKGADGLIPVAAGAGGHAGVTSPFALMQEIRQWFDGPAGIVEGKAADIVYSDLFTGVSGNYLRQSISNAGLDPDNLPKGDYSTMNFGSGGNTEAKAWRDIWGSGQGIGAVDRVDTVADMVARLEREYHAAKESLLARSNY